MRFKEGKFRFIGRKKPSIADPVADAVRLSEIELASLANLDLAQENLLAFQSDLAAISGGIFSELRDIAGERFNPGSRNDSILTRFGRIAHYYINKGNTSDAWSEKAEEKSYDFFLAFHEDKTGTVDDVKRFKATVKTVDNEASTETQLDLKLDKGLLTEVQYTQSGISAEIIQRNLREVENAYFRQYLMMYGLPPLFKKLVNENLTPYPDLIESWTISSSSVFKLSEFPSLETTLSIDHNVIMSKESEKASVGVSLGFDPEKNELLAENRTNESTRGIRFYDPKGIVLPPQTYIGLLQESLSSVFIAS